MFADAMNSLVEEVVVEAGKTVTLSCPGVTEDSLVLMLEWRANGMRLLEYKSSSTTVVRHFRDRMSMSLKNYSLYLNPVIAADSGMYECVVNNRNALDAVIKLIVRALPMQISNGNSRDQWCNAVMTIVVALKELIAAWPGHVRIGGGSSRYHAIDAEASIGVSLKAMEAFEWVMYENGYTAALLGGLAFKKSEKDEEALKLNIALCKRENESIPGHGTVSSSVCNYVNE
ncbi:hypothetical protein DMN91_011858 [Ooceraea biroi]|uniref:Ig-like domain-containing protein n=1 Tax=Ooceraea biroi TaxID=2015173 RepID=A0A3L8D6P7_OOCBI|nr:hypothetical protein DMN91_011858 [Ooceraea biroi]